MFRSAVYWTDNGVANLDRRYAVLNDHEYGGRLSAIGRSNDEIGPKVFREYFRVDPSILKV
jgi:hypothetical protein